MERKAITSLSGLICGWLIFFVLGMGTNVCHAWLWNEPQLVTINDTLYSVADYENWWQHWQEKDMALPERPDEFINWQLLAQEGVRMELDADPILQRKVATFTKVRSLMMMKNEEIDEKVTIADDELWAMYQQKFIPRLEVRIIFFSSADQAQLQHEAVLAGTLSLDALAQLAATDGGPQLVETKWVRRPQLREEWLTALKDSKSGDLRGPITMDKGALLLEVIAPEDQGNQEDFETLRSAIQDTIREQRQAELTSELVAKLSKKFDLQVDEELLAVIGVSPLDAEQREKNLITSTKGDIKAAQFQAMLEREKSFRKKYKFQKEEIEELKTRVLNSMIAQTVISWEAIDRKYDQRPPLQGTVNFYKRHRVVREVEQRLLKSASQLQPGEAQDYYVANQERYTHPETVAISLIQADEELVNMIWQEVNQGRDYFEVVKRHFPMGVGIKQLPINHFQPEVKSVLASMQPGKVSPPFKIGENYAVLKFINRRPQAVIPFIQVKNELRQQLAEQKLTQARNDLLSRLKEHSVIALDEGNWQKLHKKLAVQND